MVLSIREEQWIRQGITKYRGINRNRSWQSTNSCYLQFVLKNSFQFHFQEDQPGYSLIFVIVYMYLTLIWVLQIPTSVCLDIEGLGSLSDDEISLNISKYITTLNSRLGSTVGVSDANSTLCNNAFSVWIDSWMSKQSFAKLRVQLYMHTPCVRLILLHHNIVHTSSWLHPLTLGVFYLWSCGCAGAMGHDVAKCFMTDTSECQE